MVLFTGLRGNRGARQIEWTVWTGDTTSWLTSQRLFAFIFSHASWASWNAGSLRSLRFFLAIFRRPPTWAGTFLAHRTHTTSVQPALQVYKRACANSMARASFPETYGLEPLRGIFPNGARFFICMSACYPSFLYNFPGSVSKYFCPSIWAPVRPPIHPSIHPPISLFHLPVHMSPCLSLSLLVYFFPLPLVHIFFYIANWLNFVIFRRSIRQTSDCVTN